MLAEIVLWLSKSPLYNNAHLLLMAGMGFAVTATAFYNIGIAVQKAREQHMFQNLQRLAQDLTYKAETPGNIQQIGTFTLYQEEADE